ncbi:hypothetical protein [Microbacterium sp. WCS2018Hpa-23]|uniref:hypothetical protein n=1 Tax=Microbacterium sp. WCS2018Hpa-23 TaxID=3073634 RepID=UPI0028830FC4|nr:hypothetical protein [Microbacterium sp. WCS2018Hpa-23]
MSTSDRQDQGPLTRKQLREIRLTGSTPVITPEEAAAAAVAAPPVPPLPRAEEPVEQVEAAPAPAVEPASHDEAVASSGEAVASSGIAGASSGAARLTRRQVRERELAKTGSVPVDGEAEVDNSAADEAPVETAAAAEPLLDNPALATAVPAYTPPVPADDIDDADDEVDDEIAHTPVSASTSVDTSGEIPLAAEEPADQTDSEEDPVAAVAELGIEVESADEDDEVDPDDVLADVDRKDDADLSEGEHPTVNPAFGQGLLTDEAETRKPFSPSFDELLTVGDSTGSQHLAPNTLIFNPSPGDGSLSGPVASTGEILVTGSYELPKGLGSQGHAHGTTDGKDVDAVLIDGELPPASSPTPIAASAAVSTIKPAGEVIRPPAPEKGNKLMLILAIVAGGLALALGVSLIVAFTTNVF